MAVTDPESPDNFSNISWQSDEPTPHQNPAFEGGARMEEARNGSRSDVIGFDPTMQADALGSEQLECIVSSPVKENDGSKDAFVSYLITTHVRLPPLLPLLTTRLLTVPFVFAPMGPP